MRLKIHFRRSRIYDKILIPLRSDDFKMPADSMFIKQISQLEDRWKKLGPKIVKEIEKTTRLTYHQKETICYVTAGIVSFSDPLTLSFKKNVNVMFHILTHELIHRIFSEKQNWLKIRKNWESILQTYKKESGLTKSHIIIHAVHGHIIEKIFGREHLKREQLYIRHADYYRAWELVNKDGREKIIGRVIKGVR